MNNWCDVCGAAANVFVTIVDEAGGPPAKRVLCSSCGNREYPPGPPDQLLTIDVSGRIVPPWVKFPNVHPQSPDWLTGVGHQYLEAFNCWWSHRSYDDRDTYMHTFPEPSVWQGFYKERA